MLQVASEHKKAREQCYKFPASTERPARNATSCKRAQKGPRATLQVASDRKNAGKQRPGKEMECCSAKQIHADLSRMSSGGNKFCCKHFNLN
jgi:hypothetical protein